MYRKPSIETMGSIADLTRQKPGCGFDQQFNQLGQPVGDPVPGGVTCPVS